MPGDGGNPNPPDKPGKYIVVDITGADQAVNDRLDQAEAQGFTEWRGNTEKRAYLYKEVKNEHHL